MVSKRGEPPRPTDRESGGIIALASVGLVGASATAHVSPAPSISATVVLTAAALLALRSTHRVTIIGGGMLALASGAVTSVFFDGSLADSVSAGLLVVLTTLLASEVVRRLRAGLSTSRPTPTGSLDVRRSAEPALLALARHAVGEMDSAEIEESMEALIDALDCEAFVVWRNNEDGENFTAEIKCWAGDAAEEAGSIRWTRAPSVATTLSTGRPHIFSSIDDLPNPDRAVYRRMGISAAIEFPITVHGRWVGHASLLCRLGERTWDAREIEAVSTVADLVGSTWGRIATVDQMEHVVAQRDRSLAIQRAISESAQMIFESDDEELTGVLRLILGGLGGDAAYVMNVRYHDLHGPGFETVASALSPGVRIPGHLEVGSWVTVPTPYLRSLSGDAVMISDRADLPPQQQAWYSTNMPAIQSEMVFPIVGGGTVVGVLGLAAPVPRTWDAAEMRTLSTIAQMIGVARTRADARRGLEGIVKAKDSFIASVSHELRTPMAVVMGLSAELNARWSDFSKEEVTEFIDLIARESSEVSHIIDDLLIAARASADSITVIPELIRLDQVVTEAIAAMSRESTHRIMSADLAEVSTLADPLRVRQIVRNLVANGHRHGGASIFVKVSEVDGMAVLEVSDDGSGIPADRRDEIFEAYEVGESSGRTASIGLGLTVSRKLARLMGGDVTYTPEPMPTFRLALPVGALRSQSHLRVAS